MTCLNLTLAFFLTLISVVEAGRTCRVLFLGAANDTPKELLLFDGKAYQKVELPDMNLSPVYELPEGPLNLKLFQKEPTNPEEIAVAPSATMAEDIKHIYLIVSHEAKNTHLPVSMQVINADFGKFTNGEMLWLNLTEKRIVGTLGNLKLDLQPKSRAVSKAPMDGAGAYPVALYFQSSTDKRPWPICETSWSHNPAGRIVMFVVPGQGSKLQRIMDFPDFRVEKEQKKDNAH
jgi:hypothetical protein